jgi:hypothetical protein
MRGEFTSFKRWLQTSQGWHTGWQAPRTSLYLARSQAPRVTNTSASQNMNQVLFRVRESMDLLSNRVWDLFLSRIDGESWELKVAHGGERGKHFSAFARTERFWGRRETLERKGKGINTPYPQRSLKSRSAAAQVRQCHSAALSLSRCNTAALDKTTRVRMKC